eukprot:COSAG05_NODE_8252_length_722_cov_1.524880_1_plen_109_part_00
MACACSAQLLPLSVPSCDCEGNIVEWKISDPSLATEDERGAELPRSDDMSALRVRLCVRLSAATRSNYVRQDLAATRDTNIYCHYLVCEPGTRMHDTLLDIPLLAPFL